MFLRLIKNQEWKNVIWKCPNLLFPILLSCTLINLLFIYLFIYLFMLLLFLWRGNEGGKAGSSVFLFLFGF